MSIPLIGKKPEKSVKLLQTELDSLTELRTTANSDKAFSTDFKIDRVSLLRIMLVGSGSEKNIKKIRRKLSRITSTTNA